LGFLLKVRFITFCIKDEMKKFPIKIEFVAFPNKGIKHFRIGSFNRLTNVKML